MQDRLVTVRKELETDDARQEKDEHGELQDSQRRPGSVGPRERVDERALELILDRLRSVAVVVEKLPFAGVEHKPADHQVDPGQRHPVGDAVEDRPPTHKRERFVRSLDLHPSLLS
jgi:hypothetical protein